MRRLLAVLACGALVLGPVGSFQALRAAEDEAPLTEARRLLLRGNYAESAELYSDLADKHPQAAVGLARSLASQGKVDEAIKTLEAALERHGDSAVLHAELALMHFERGDHQAAGKSVAAALEADENALAARWVQAELHRTSGRLKEADAAYKWFVDYYNGHDVDDPQSLRWIGRGAAQFARWNRLADQFSFLVNELFPDALELDADYWPAHYEAGRLFLEKYNQADASREFKAALKINPHAAEVHAALAELALQNYDLDEARRSLERAREINPQLLAAHQLQADYLLANFQTDEAVAVLDEARQLNPLSEETLGRLAAAYIALDGLPQGQAEDETRVGKLIAEMTAHNPHCGEFFFTAALRLGDRRKFPEAERLFLEALERLPQHPATRGELGLMYMRLGEEVKAEKLLHESFEVDPFNVRVSNTLKVLEVLSGYAVLETEHFIIKFDRGRDEVLARYAAKYLEEEVYPELCRKFGFEPEGKSLFEIFSRARNTSGHGWFSARMVGLPYVGTVGACAGKMVALASPNDMDQKFNWARVLKHEFIHVLNLQQTNFNIPHWYTEALAVLHEGYPRPEIWDQLLAARVPKGEIFNLDTINLGFIRPKTSLDWQMAYCQAELYAEYMLERFGDDALARLLEAYADNLSTPAAIERAFQVDKDDFERGYLEHLKKVVAALSPGKPQEQELSLAELVRAQAADPENPDLAARLALEYLNRKSYPEARKLARQALAKEPKHQAASYVQARIHLLVGDSEEAIAVLEAALNPDQPDENVVNLLAALRLRAEQFDEAERLYKLAARHDPHSTRWPKALARVYLLAGNNEKLAQVLAELAARDADELNFRKKLAQLALARKDYPAAVRWAREAVFIDVMDADVHRMLAEALAADGKPAAAVEEYEVCLKLSPGDADIKLALAKSCVAAKQLDKARATLRELLKAAPDSEEAQQLLDELE